MKLLDDLASGNDDSSKLSVSRGQIKHMTEDFLIAQKEFMPFVLDFAHGPAVLDEPENFALWLPSQVISKTLSIQCPMELIRKELEL